MSMFKDVCVKDMKETWPWPYPSLLNCCGEEGIKEIRVIISFKAIRVPHTTPVLILHLNTYFPMLLKVYKLQKYTKEMKAVNNTPCQMERSRWTIKSSRIYRQLRLITLELFSVCIYFYSYPLKTQNEASHSKSVSKHQSRIRERENCERVQWRLVKVRMSERWEKMPLTSCECSLTPSLMEAEFICSIIFLRCSPPLSPKSLQTLLSKAIKFYLLSQSPVLFREIDCAC